MFHPHPIRLRPSPPSRLEPCTPGQCPRQRQSSAAAPVVCGSRPCLGLLSKLTGLLSQNGNLQSSQPSARGVPAPGRVQAVRQVSPEPSFRSGPAHQRMPGLPLRVPFQAGPRSIHSRRFHRHRAITTRQRLAGFPCPCRIGMSSSAGRGPPAGQVVTIQPSFPFSHTTPGPRWEAAEADDQQTAR